MAIAKFWSFSKRKNSTASPDMESGTEKQITYKRGTSFLTPVLLLNDEDFPYNYCEFNSHYYWITDIKTVRENLYEITCKVDVLATWKEAIQNTTAFVEYSASDTNQNIKDSRNVVTVNKERTSYNVLPEEFDEGGFYILCTLSGSGSEVVNKSFSTMYGLSAGQLGAIASEFNSEDCFTQLSQFLSNPLDTIVFCRWIPLSLISGPTRIVNVKFGTYEASGTGTLIIDNQRTFTVELKIPWQKSDYRAVEPFTSGSLYLPGVGMVQLSLEPLRGIETINLYVTVDYVTNGIHYTLANPSTNDVLGTYSGSVGVDIPISSVQSDNIGGVLSGVGTAAAGLGGLAVAGLVTGGIGTAAAVAGLGAVAGGVGSAIAASATQNIKSTGTFGGGYNVKSGSMVIRLELTRSLSVQEPSEYLATIGNPCMKTRQIKGLSGITKTSGFEVGGNMTLTEKTEINSLMDGGVYIE